MSKLSAETEAKTRKLTTVLLRRLAQVGQNTLADRLGCSETAISRGKEDNIKIAAEFLAALELDLWPEEVHRPDPEEYLALRTLSQRYLGK